MLNIPFRKKLKISILAVEAAGKLRYVWKYTRKYQCWLLGLYKRIGLITDNKGIERPKPLINMDKE